MTTATLEHVNFTASDPQATAAWLCNVFDWKIRWTGDSIYGGTTVHVGSDDTYLAIYSIGHVVSQDPRKSYHVRGGLNHMGIVVDDLDKVEAKLKAVGFEPHSHANYEPGRRFYFRDNDGIEFEIVSYSE
mgnify:FL=1